MGNLFLGHPVVFSWLWSGGVCGHQPRVRSEWWPGHNSGVRDEDWGMVQRYGAQSFNHHTNTQYGTKEELFTAFLTSFESFHRMLSGWYWMIMYISMFTLPARRAPWAQQARTSILMCSVRGCLDSWWEEWLEGPPWGSSQQDTHLTAKFRKLRGMSCRESRVETKTLCCHFMSQSWIDLNISFTLSIIFTFGGYSSRPRATLSKVENKTKVNLNSYLEGFNVSQLTQGTLYMLECRTSWPGGIAAHKYLKRCVNWLKTKCLRAEKLAES